MRLVKMANYQHFEYMNDDYLSKHPSLHEEDSEWKFGIITPLLDEFLQRQSKNRLIVLDVGGGAGRIISQASNYIEERYGVRVQKVLLDLSPGALSEQVKRNPDYTKALNEDVRRTSLADGEIDLALMVDVLEHIPEPEMALEELRRISRFVLFKVPLEDCAYNRIADIFFRDYARRISQESTGHCNFYDERRLTDLISRYCGKPLVKYIPDVRSHTRSKREPKELEVEIMLPYLLSPLLYAISPGFHARLFASCIVMLVECRHD